MSELSVGTLSGLAANGYVIDVASGSSLDVTNATGTLPAAQLPAGSILRVVSTTKTDIFSASVPASGNVEVTGLTITHAMSSASNKLILMGFFGTAATTEGRGRVGNAFADNGTLIGIGDADGSRTRTASGGITSITSSNENVTMPHIHLEYSPGDTASHTYALRAVNITSATQTLYVNRTQLDFNDGSTPRGVSALTLMEVAG